MTFLVTALGLASVLVVALALQKRDLMERVQEAGARARDPHRGLYVPTLDIETMAGDSVRLGESRDGTVQVLFVFNTTCEYCKASLPAWKKIASTLGGEDGVGVYGISLRDVEETVAYAAEQQLTFPIVSFEDRKLRALYRSQFVPQTLVLNSEGRVEYARLGPVTENVVVDSILTQISTTLGRQASSGNP